VFARALSVVAVFASLTIATNAFADDDEENTFVPTASESSGPAVMLRGKAAGGPETQYTSDSMAGVLIRVGEEDRFALEPQIGYAKDGFGFDGAAVACALGVGSPRFGYVSYQPRFILGAKDGDIGIGMRNGIAYHSPKNLFTAEIGHQFVSANGALEHDVRASLGFNAGGLLDFL
jgi:hypothetical protein